MPSRRFDYGPWLQRNCTNSPRRETAEMKPADGETEAQAQAKTDVENVAACLFRAYPSANYIALNTALTLRNQSAWRDHWYFVGFADMPVYQDLDGFPEWVANSGIRRSEDEWGLFFLHVSSKGHEYRGEPIQRSRDDYASPRHFCWRRNPDGTMTQLVSDELKPTLTMDAVKDDFMDMVSSMVVQPALDALDPEGGRR